MTFRPIYRALAPLAALAAALTLTAAAQAATPAGTATGTKIIVAGTPFGPALAVGSGPFKNRTLYFISSDNPPSYGCTTGPTKTPFGPIACTGPSADRRAEWPAITTVGKPVAGPGVNAKLLGTVHRKGVGTQVTYRGHPLYLFSFEFGPGQVVGEGFFEPGLPPWHGVWWLMSPRGFPLPWAGTLTTAKIGGKTVLAASYLTEPGWINFPLYTFSADKPRQGRLLGERGLRSRVAADDHQRQARLDRRAGVRHRRAHHPRQTPPGHLERPPAVHLLLRDAQAAAHRQARARGQRQRDQGIRRHLPPRRQSLTRRRPAALALVRPAAVGAPPSRPGNNGVPGALAGGAVRRRPGKHSLTRYQRPRKSGSCGCVEDEPGRWTALASGPGPACAPGAGGLGWLAGY